MCRKLTDWGYEAAHFFYYVINSYQKILREKFPFWCPYVILEMYCMKLISNIKLFLNIKFDLKF